METENDYKKRVQKAVLDLINANPHDERIRAWVKDNFPELCETKEERCVRRLLDILERGLEGAIDQDQRGCNRQRDIEALEWGIEQLHKLSKSL